MSTETKRKGIKSPKELMEEDVVQSVGLAKAAEKADQKMCDAEDRETNTDDL